MIGGRIVPLTLLVAFACVGSGSAPAQGGPQVPPPVDAGGAQAPGPSEAKADIRVLDPNAAAECAGGVPLTVADGAGGAVATLRIPEDEDGPARAIDCAAMGRVEGGVHGGKELVSCVAEDGGKGAYPSASVARYLRDGTSWTFLPCASDSAVQAVHAALVDQRMTVLVDTRASLPARLVPLPALPVGQGASKLLYRAASASPGSPTLSRSPIGPVYSAPAEGWRGPKHALLVPQADRTVLVYDWQPTLTWDGDPPATQPYTVQTKGCDGSPEVLLNLEPGIQDADLEAVARLADGTVVSRLSSPDHPVNQRLLSWYASLTDKEDHERPRELDLGLSAEALLASRPWLFLKDPWGRHVRLMRTDFEVPAMCEPILYVYADPPRPVTIAPVAPLRFFRTEPFGPNGWSGVAQPDGSVVIDGERHPELFWEGRGYWFQQPAVTSVVAREQLAAFLRGEVEARGLVGVEVEAFLEAWLPDLEAHPAVRIGFHEPALIEATAPLAIHPRPDTVIRVLMDAAPTEDSPDWDGRFTNALPLARKGLVVVEWGGLLR
jgi:hypothetical protein